ncbi:flagellar protein FliT [Pseudomonas sp. MOB-449]|nr:flagellar protein FliT [Pseudomonas sp. MOB-449]
MTPSVQRLETTGVALREALARQDWAAIGELDQLCRQAVDDAMVDASDDTEQLGSRLQELLALYQELVSICQAERQRIASELIQLNQSQQGAKVYKLFG